jgi:hypothetical protein
MFFEKTSVRIRMASLVTGLVAPPTCLVAPPTAGLVALPTCLVAPPTAGLVALPTCLVAPPTAASAPALLPVLSVHSPLVYRTLRPARVAGADKDSQRPVGSTAAAELPRRVRLIHDLLRAWRKRRPVSVARRRSVRRRSVRRHRGIVAHGALHPSDAADVRAQSVSRPVHITSQLHGPGTREMLNREKPPVQRRRADRKDAARVDSDAVQLCRTNHVLLLTRRRMEMLHQTHRRVCRRLWGLLPIARHRGDVRIRRRRRHRRRKLSGLRRRYRRSR